MPLVAPGRVPRWGARVVGDALTNSYRGGGHHVLGLIFDAIVGFRHGLVAVVARSTAQGGPFPAALETCATHKALMPFDAELNRATTPQRQPTPAEPLFELYPERDQTLIISLGIVTRPFHLLVIEIAVAILTLQAIAINRLAGIDYPLWALRDGSRRRERLADAAHPVAAPPAPGH